MINISHIRLLVGGVLLILSASLSKIGERMVLGMFPAPVESVTK